MGKDKERRGISAKDIALVGVFAATVECGKLALSGLPNIEVVTILLALYGYVFGWRGIAAAFVFVAIEPALWGFGTWTILYLIYWPLVALVFLLLGRVGLKNRFALAGIAVGLTVFFGVLSAFIDISIYTGFTPGYWERLVIYYSRGVTFYALQIGCNAVLFTLLFPFLQTKLSKLKQRIV